MARDYDSPKMRQMHTAEHILNSVMVKLFNQGRCFSSHINADKSKCDYNFTTALSKDDIVNIETNVNTILKSNTPITETKLSIAEASQTFNLSRLPEDAGSTVRIIKVGNYDACPCSGEHVENTSEIGEFHIISHDFENNRLRLRFKLTTPQ